MKKGKLLWVLFSMVLALGLALTGCGDGADGGGTGTETGGGSGGGDESVSYTGTSADGQPVQITITAARYVAKTGDSYVIKINGNVVSEGIVSVYGDTLTFVSTTNITFTLTVFGREISGGEIKKEDGTTVSFTSPPPVMSIQAKINEDTAVTKDTAVSNNGKLISAGYDETTGNYNLLYRIGRINDIFSHYVTDGIPGGKGYELSYTTSKETLSSASLNETVSESVTAGVEAGVDIFGASVKASIESTLGISLSVTKTIEEAVAIGANYSYNFEYLDSDKLYAFAMFSSMDFYQVFSYNPSNGTATPIMENGKPRVYYDILDKFSYQIYEFIPENEIEFKTLDAWGSFTPAFSSADTALLDSAKEGEGPPEPPIGIALPLDVWGEKLVYTYKILSPGDVSYTLTGGGSGGAGGTAVREQNIWPWASEADAGWSADGGDTILRVNNILVAVAKGGKGVNGPSKKVSIAEWSSDGDPGNDGKTEKGSRTVKAGDIITIEVGYGGGGSGGAANNTDGGKAASGSSSSTAEKTLGTEGSVKKAGSNPANATRGGVGAMHGLLDSSSLYPADIQKGSDAPAPSGDVPGAKGGEGIGKGGSGGKASKTGGMYASGGGGGAAGGFELDSSDVSLTEVK